MKTVTNIRNDKFKPFTLELHLENMNEVRAIYQLFNLTGIVKFLRKNNIDPENVREVIKETCKELNNESPNDTNFNVSLHQYIKQEIV